MLESTVHTASRARRRGTALFAAVALGAALAAASPAQAVESEFALTATPTTFAEGDWGSGVAFTVTGIPQGVDEVTVQVERLVPGYPETWGATYSAGGTGEITGTILPDEAGGPFAPHADYERIYPAYRVAAYYELVAPVLYADTDTDTDAYPEVIYAYVDLTVIPAEAPTPPAPAPDPTATEPAPAPSVPSRIETGL